MPRASVTTSRGRQGSVSYGKDGLPRHLSCEPCRKRKTKCDRTVPCGTCMIKGVECEWSRQVPERRHIPPAPATLEENRNEIARLHKVIAQLESMIVERQAYRPLTPPYDPSYPRACSDQYHQPVFYYGGEEQGCYNDYRNSPPNESTPFAYSSSYDQDPPRFTNPFATSQKIDNYDLPIPPASCYGPPISPRLHPPSRTHWTTSSQFNPPSSTSHLASYSLSNYQPHYYEPSRTNPPQLDPPVVVQPHRFSTDHPHFYSTPRPSHPPAPPLAHQPQICDKLSTLGHSPEDSLTTRLTQCEDIQNGNANRERE